MNLYGSVIMLIEFLSTGAPVFTQEVKVFRLTSYIGPFGVIVILFQVSRANIPLRITRNGSLTLFAVVFDEENNI